MSGNHGISWSIYCHDRDGNNIELFVDTEWYFPQPFLVPLDLTKSDADRADFGDGRAQCTRRSRCNHVCKKGSSSPDT